jgi:hypothetical protein
MDGKTHLAVILAGMMGLFLGGVMIDLDHSGLNPKMLWKCFLNVEGCNAQRGILHIPIIGISMAIFFLMLGIGMLLHLWMDGVS